MILFTFCIFGILYSCGADFVPGVATSETFSNSKVLDADGNYLLFWNFNDSHVTFEVHARTKGWVGFGLSSNGNMFPADVVIGWVNDDGTTHFSDRHTEGHVAPVIDKSQDWHLLLGKENEFGTILKFVRKIQTCDDAEDEIVEEGTSRVIFAYGTNDPADDNSITYHGTTRGTKSIELLRPNSEPKTAPAGSRHVDFLNNNFEVPSSDTTYSCRGFVMPNITKHHMIKYEVIVTPGNEMNVHHMVVYRCRTPNPAQWDGYRTDCYSWTRKLPNCADYIIAWGIGGGPFYFPDDVGFPIGGPDDEDYLYIVETHFDNPQLLSDIIDNSGVRITMTSNLRQHDAGLLTLGHGVSYFQIVPPGQKAFATKTYCSEECLSEGFTQSNLTEIKAIGVMEHSHLLGVAMKTRHFRNGVELKPLAEDPHFDFNFQQIRALPKEIAVHPGDSFEVDCIYDSSKLTGPTIGGLSTHDEMCLSFIYYYPVMKLSSCISSPNYSNFPFAMKDLKHVIDTTDWTNGTVVDYFVKNIEKSDVFQYCVGEHLKSPDPQQTFSPFKNEHPYVPPTPDCS